MDRIGILATARRVRSIKAALEHIWEVLGPLPPLPLSRRLRAPVACPDRSMHTPRQESETFRISDAVYMVEVELLQRLYRDGVFPWIQDAALVQRGVQVRCPAPRLARRVQGRRTA